jgi:hypothetical protein
MRIEVTALGHLNGAVEVMAVVFVSKVASIRLHQWAVEGKRYPEDSEED